MALVSLPSSQGIILAPWGVQTGTIPGAVNGPSTIDAAGESVGIVGKLILEGGSGSKTLSAAGGGKIHWRTGSVTWATAGSTIRVGVQDLSGGVEDGTHDVYAELVRGVDSLASNTAYASAMTSGTKSMTHGTTYAVVCEMTVRNGADSLTVTGSGTGQLTHFPYCTVDSGSGPAPYSGYPNFSVAIEFDDGTWGFIEGVLPPMGAQGILATYGTGSSPNEYGLIWQLPFPCRVTGMVARLAYVASTDDFDLIAYSTPLGTPASAASVSFDADALGLTDGFIHGRFGTPFTMAANTDYCFAVKPTTANTLVLSGVTLANAGFRKSFLGGTNIRLGSRTTSGAFSEATTSLPAIGIVIDQLDDGTGSGSGGGARFF